MQSHKKIIKKIIKRGNTNTITIDSESMKIGEFNTNDSIMFIVKKGKIIIEKLDSDDINIK